MNKARRPIAVLILACLYIVVGAAGIVGHFPHGAFHREDVWIELTELLALVAGIFMLRGHSWARWLAIAWMAFHVVISWPSLSRLAIHTILLAAIAWLLLEPGARRYFAGQPRQGPGGA